MTDATILEILHRAVRLAAPDTRPGPLLDEALRNAGRLHVPEDPRELQVFVTGPLLQAAQQLTDEETAEQIVAVLAKHFQWRSTAVGMRAAESDVVPTSNPPDRISVPHITTRASSLRPRPATTLSYIEMGQTGRPLDVMLYDPDSSRIDPLAQKLAAEGIFAAPVTELEVAEELCETVGPALVLYPIEVDPKHIRILHRALDRSDAEHSVFRSYGKAGADTRPSTGPNLRYRSLDQLVDRIVHLLGDREETGS